MYWWFCWIGLTVEIGSHLESIGLCGRLNAGTDWLGLESKLQFKYYFKGYGPPGKWQELLLSAGMQVNWGKRHYQRLEYRNLAGYPAVRNNGLGYQFKYYFDNRKTNQATGAIKLWIDRWEAVLENDVFSGLHGDKYRTGGFGLRYLNRDCIADIRVILWTGNPHQSDCVYPSDSAPELGARFGYFSMQGSNYGKYSHGIATVGFSTISNFNTYLTAQIGIDDERIRNFWQNRLIHDGLLFPNKWYKAKNPHVPMLDKTGTVFRGSKFQILRPSRWYCQYSLNSLDFY